MFLFLFCFFTSVCCFGVGSLAVFFFPGFGVCFVFLFYGSTLFGKDRTGFWGYKIL